MTAVYLDSSAFIKVAVEEAESDALRAFLASQPDRQASSALLRTEALRAVRRQGAGAVAAVREALRAIDIIAIDDEILEMAATLEPDIVRTLDAIHLATALTMGDELVAIVTYDKRMIEAAGLLGLTTASPARS